MKRFLSPNVPLMVFRSRPNHQRQLQQQQCGCSATSTMTTLATEDETCTMAAHACDCPIDACNTCGLDDEESIQTEGQQTRSRRPYHLFVTVCMHGNEQAGMVAMNELIAEGAVQTLLDQRGMDTKLTVMIGNPRAVAINKRFVEKNLNRVFHPEWLEGEDDPIYEAKRARLLTRMATRSDQWLDIHTTSSPCTAYALPAANPQSEEMADKLDIGMVISNLAHITCEGGTSCDWALKHNKACVCVECGHEGVRETIDAAKRVIMSFILGHRLSHQKKRFVGINQVRVGKGFRYMRPVHSFEHVAHNELVAVDDEVGEIRCPFEEGALVIMPTSAPIVGEEAWFWGRANLEIECV